MASFLDKTFSLQGKTAVVTGAARGIGCGITEALLRAHATVIMVGSRPQPLREAAEKYRDDGLNAIDVSCDLSQREQIDQLVHRVSEEFQQLDVLVNNAGISLPQNSPKYPISDWEKTLRINLEAPFLLVQGLTPLLTKPGASVINITSVNAEVGFPNNPSYQAAKGGLRQLSKSQAMDLGQVGIRVNSIGPGYFISDMTQGSWDDLQRRSERSEHTILGRWGQPKDLMGLVILLASDASSYITGQDIYIDGGWLAKGL